MHPDCAVDAVVDQHDDNRQAILNGGRKLLSIHEKIAVAGKAHDRPLRKHSRRADRCRHAKAHRAGGGPDLLLNPTEAQKAPDPDGEVSGAGCEDRVRRPATQCEHDFAELNAAQVWRRLIAPGQIIGPRLTGFGWPRNCARWLLAFERRATRTVWGRI